MLQNKIYALLYWWRTRLLYQIWILKGINCRNSLEARGILCFSKFSSIIIFSPSSWDLRKKQKNSLRDLKISWWASRSSVLCVTEIYRVSGTKNLYYMASILFLNLKFLQLESDDSLIEIPSHSIPSKGRNPKHNYI